MKKAWYQTKWGSTLLHISAWALLFSLPTLLSSSHNDNRPPVREEEQETLGMVIVWIMNFSWIAFFYLNALVLIPRLVNTKKYWIYVAALLISLLALLTENWLLFRLRTGPEQFNIGRHIIFNFFIYLFFWSSSTAYQMVKDKLESERIQAEKENENLKTELSLLRSQASPHFMFNVLNNMVALARKKSDLLEPSLIKLSALMRYMLYESDEEKVSLETEIEYLESYIDLQQQRFGNKVKIDKEFEQTDTACQLEPMLLIPFVENAFKHGVGMIEDAVISIRLKVENNRLLFTVKNRFNRNIADQKDDTSGIGLTNVKRRLNLLYGNRQQLNITEKDNWFIVSLQIQLN